MTIRVVVADDHTLVRESLVALLEASGRIGVVAQVADGLAAIEASERFRPDVLVLDLSMPRLGGIEAIGRLQAALPGLRILVLTMHTEEEYILHLVQKGVHGYLAKDSPASDLVAAVERVHSGQTWFGPQAAQVLARRLKDPGRPSGGSFDSLSPRERDVFHLLAQGLTTKEIARRLGIAVKTAEHHRLRVLAKLQLRNAAELVRFAARRGLIGPERDP